MISFANSAEAEATSLSRPCTSLRPLWMHSPRFEVHMEMKLFFSGKVSDDLQYACDAFWYLPVITIIQKMKLDYTFVLHL